MRAHRAWPSCLSSFPIFLLSEKGMGPLTFHFHQYLAQKCLTLVEKGVTTVQFLMWVHAAITVHYSRVSSTEFQYEDCSLIRYICAGLKPELVGLKGVTHDC